MRERAIEIILKKRGTALVQDICRKEYGQQNIGRKESLIKENEMQ